MRAWRATRRTRSGYLDGGLARFGKSYIGEPDAIAAELAMDAAVAASDTLIVTVPNQLGVDYNAHLLASIAEHVAPGDRVGTEPLTPVTASPRRSGSSAFGERARMALHQTPAP